MSIPDNEINEHNDQVHKSQWEAVLRQVGIEPNDQTVARFDSVLAIRNLVGNVYPNKFVRTNVCDKEDTITNLKAYEPIKKIVGKMETWKKEHEGERPDPEFKDGLNAELREFGNVRIAGRLTTPTRGNFVHLTDGISKLQVYCNKKGPLALIKNDVDDTLGPESGWALWQLLDHGDLIGVEGYLFVTNTGEVSVHVEKLQFLAKAMLPMPDKMHGIADAEMRQRQRYYDLIGSSLRIKTEEEIEKEKRTGIRNLTTREVFQTRAKIISSMRQFLELNDYVEVETPMLTPKATGAAAKPFKTHHNALDIDLYARIAPELYLKRLVVGGFEKVYELNRNFRNEGISYKHNPEFTMLEFYCAYMDVDGMMNFCEKMMRQSVEIAIGQLEVNYQIKIFEKDEEIAIPMKIDFCKPFRRVSMIKAIVDGLEKWCPELGGEKITDGWFFDPIRRRRLHYALMRLAKEGALQSMRNVSVATLINEAEIMSEVERKKGLVWQDTLKVIPQDAVINDNETSFARDVLDLFDEVGEVWIDEPTFVVDYPKAISPLSKASPENPNVAERFELFINGMEVANGFSELNDPKEQYDRFVEQMSERERGDEEAMILDEDYIRALSYGMPPAAGIGIGIDRLVMLLTNKHSIRDVILFPHMRPEKRSEQEEEI